MGMGGVKRCSSVKCKKIVLAQLHHSWLSYFCFPNWILNEVCKKYTDILERYVINKHFKHICVILEQL